MSRSSSFPSYSLEECISFSKEFYHKLGKSEHTSVESIEAAFGKSYQTFKQKLSSCGQYGLIEVKKRYGYKPSQLLIDIIFPTSDLEEYESKLKAFCNPPLYQFIIEKYNNEILPVRQALGNVIIKAYGVTHKAIDDALDVLFANINYLGLIREGTNMFKLKKDVSEAIDKIEIRVKAEEDSIKTDTTNVFPSVPKKEGGDVGTPFGENLVLPKNDLGKNFREIPIFLDTERTAFLRIPNDLTYEDLEFIKSSVDLHLKRLLKS